MRARARDGPCMGPCDGSSSCIFFRETHVMHFKKGKKYGALRQTTGTDLAEHHYYVNGSVEAFDDLELV